MNNQKISFLLLRIGLGFVFLYAAIASFIEPSVWEAYLPVFLIKIFPQSVILNIFSVYEITLALWILSGKLLFYSSLLISLSLIGIIVANISLMDIVFRDVAILFSSLALAVANVPKKRS